VNNLSEVSLDSAAAEIEPAISSRHRACQTVTDHYTENCYILSVEQIQRVWI